MTALTLLHSERSRHAGDRRLAGRSRAPLGAVGTGMQCQDDAERITRWRRMSRHGARKQPWIGVTFSRTSGFGYRTLDAGEGGAGSGFRGNAP